MNLQKLKNLLPLSIIDLLDELKLKQFEASLVGGFCRDYILNQRVSKDLDIELRYQGNKEIDQAFKSLYADLINGGLDCEELNFNILRIKIENFEIEISPVRIENFNDKISHSNFTAQYIPDLDYTQSFKRRDLTINAISFLYKEGLFELLDPCQGVSDLSNKILKAVDLNLFIKDPVRVLRAIRFYVKLNFKIDPSLEKVIRLYDKELYSPFYLKIEAIKSTKPLQFYNEVYSLKLADFTMYDSLFDGNLEGFIKLAPFHLDKELLISALKLSLKGIYKFDYQMSIVDFDTNKESIDSFLSAFAKYDLSVDLQQYILSICFKDMDLDQYKRFKKTKYLLTEEDKASSSSDYKWIILKKRLEITCK